MANPALALFFAVLLSACGAAAPAPGNLLKPPPPNAALDKWKDFPAGAHPRPIIAFNDQTVNLPQSGFPNGDSKMAWVCGKFVLAAGLSLPAPPSKAIAGGSAYPAIGAAQAWRALMSQPAGGNPTDCATVHSFSVTSVRWGTESFPTDRGPMQMSAWLFDIPEVNAYLAHSALDPSAYWGGAVMGGSARGARVSADGRTLSIAVGNAFPGPCGSDYTASVAESVSAVAVAVRQYPHSSPGDAVVCPAIYRMSSITVTLAAPLGGRVLLDERGQVGVACPESGEC